MVAAELGAASVILLEETRFCFAEGSGLDTAIGEINGAAAELLHHRRLRPDYLGAIAADQGGLALGRLKRVRQHVGGITIVGDVRDRRRDNDPDHAEAERPAADTDGLLGRPGEGQNFGGLVLGGFDGSDPRRRPLGFLLNRPGGALPAGRDGLGRGFLRLARLRRWIRFRAGLDGGRLADGDAKATVRLGGPRGGKAI